MTNKNIDILVIGEINADLVLTGNVIPEFGQAEKIIDDAVLTIGSSGAIFACGAARLGLSVAYSGVVGNDMFGRFMINNLYDKNVHIDGIQVDPTLKTGLSVILSHPHDRAILTYSGAIKAQSAEHVDRSLLAKARHIHITSYFLQTALQPGLPALLNEAHELGCTISMDTNWDPAECWNSNIDKVLPLLDIFLPNEQEALALTCQPCLTNALAQLGQIIPTVVIKLGAAGAITQQKELCLEQTGFSVKTIDTTGAGDSFDAGFIYSYLNGYSLAQSLRMACACGALSTRALGGTAMQATLTEAISLMNS